MKVAIEIPTVLHEFELHHRLVSKHYFVKICFLRYCINKTEFVVYSNISAMQRQWLQKEWL